MSLEFLRLQKFYQKDGFVSAKRNVIAAANTTLVVADTSADLIAPPPEGPLSQYTPITSIVEGRETTFYPSQASLHAANLKSSVVKYEEQLQSVIDSFAPAVDIMMSTMKNRVGDAAVSLSEYVDGFMAASSKKKTVENLIEEINARVPQQTLTDVLNIPLMPLNEIDGTLSTLRFSNPKKEELATLKTKFAKVDAMWFGIGGQHSVGTSFPDVAAFMNTDALQYIREDLAHSDSAITKLQELLEVAIEKQAHATLRQKNDVVAEATETILQTLDQLLVAKADRLEAVRLGAEDPVSFIENFETWVKGLNTSLDALANHKNELLNDTKKSIELTQQYTAAEKEKDYNSTHAVQENARVILEQIDANANEQLAVLMKVKELLATLDPLVTQRSELVNTLLSSIGAEATRHAEYQHSAGLAASYLKDLTALEAHTKHCVAAAVKMSSSVRSAQQGMAEIDPLGSLDKVTVDEEMSYLNSFATYATQFGDYVNKLELRLAGVRKQRRALVSQIETAQETMDPEIERYIEDESNLETAETTQSKKMTTLKERMAVHVTVFGKVEEDLTDRQVPFENPLLNMAEHLVVKRSEDIEKHRTFAEHEQREVEKESVAVRKQKLVIDVAKSDTEQQQGSTGTPSDQTGGDGGKPPRTASAERRHKSAAAMLLP